MKITLYEKDEFPITYNTETNEKICIGFCNQCPLFCQYAETGNDNIDCDRIIKNKILEEINKNGNNSIEHYYLCMDLVVQQMNSQEYSIYANFMDKIKNNLDEYGLVSPYEAIMSAERYYNISKLITFPEETIVVDCGCGEGIQQVFFKHCKKYIGIDVLNTQEKICSNAEFILGDIRDVLPKLELKGRNIGISVLCGMCFEGVNKAMKEKFTDLIII